MTQSFNNVQVRSAQDAEEIKPLLELCKAGRLFEVQAWIDAGKPINPSSESGKRYCQSPLDVAIDQGFHSLVEVLLKGGAQFAHHGYGSPMNRSLRVRRFDLVKLLVEHGYDPATINLQEVFDTWDPELVEYFIERGADAESGRPLAYALCNRIQTALRVFKRYRDRFPSFPEQVNIALRHHCKEGNLKWISLMLWAGADPFSQGAYDYDDESDPDGGISAVGLAALYGHYEIFSMKRVRLDPKHPSSMEVARYARTEAGLNVLEKLLKGGLEVNDLPNGGCSMLQSCLSGMGWTVRFDSPRWWEKRQVDSQETRQGMEVVYMLTEHGAKWLPRDQSDVNAVRRSLLKLSPEYTVELVGVMSHFKATTRENLVVLLRTKSIKTHIEGLQQRVEKLLEHW